MRWFLLFLINANLSFASVDCSHKKVPGTSPLISGEFSKHYDEVNRLLCKNLKMPSRFFPGYRSHPAKPYKAAYLWDTAFISLIWLDWDVKIAQELISYIMRFQKDSGIVHHAVLELLVKPYPYNQSQPPLLSWAAWKIFEKSQDKIWLSEIFPKLERYQDWLRKNRRHSDGLYFWHHPYESGIDNSPRFSNRDESFFDDTRQMAAVDMNSYIVLSLEALGKMSLVLKGKNLFEIERQEVVQKINSKLWDPVNMSYHDWDYRKKDFIRIHTVSDLTPLVAGIPNRERADIIVRRIMDPSKYNTLIPFPSVSRDENIFIKDMWRGPVWINMAYLGILGVQRYGYESEARLLSKKLYEGVYRTLENEGSVFEFYDPDRYDISELDRKKGNLWKKLTLGSKPVKEFVGWSGLVNVLYRNF
jgi:glycogen debranching enzyme